MAKTAQHETIQALREGEKRGTIARGKSTKRELTVNPLWHKQKGESTQAYEAFMAYMSLPTDDRTTRNAAKQVGKSQSLLTKWCFIWSWRLRAAAYEEHYLLLRLDSAAADRDTMYLQQKALAEEAQNLVMASIRHWASKIEEGQLADLGQDAMVKLLAEASKLQRMAVLGRAESAEAVAAENERLADRWAKELAELMKAVIDECNLDDRQKAQFKVVMTRHLTGNVGA
jgi:hypothetical protein